MDGVNLMTRNDTKFAFLSPQLPLVLDKLKEHYQLLTIHGNSVCSYKTLYFDTADLKLYAMHHNGRLNRYKVRYRNYVENNKGFLEIKFKNNKGKVIKKRIASAEPGATWNNDAFNFLRTNTPYDPSMLVPLLWVNYKRITLVGKEFKERVTFDMEIEFSSASKKHVLDNLIIAEVKQAEKIRTPVMAVLKNLKIKEEPLSKFCLGVMHIYPQAKKNNFKEKLVTLNKLIYDTSVGTAPGI